MDCEAIRELMMDVLYGEADATATRLLEEHHARCRVCRDELDALKRLRRDLARWSLPEEVRPRSRVAGRALPFLALAASLLLAVGGVAEFAVFREGERELRELMAAQGVQHEQDIQALRAPLTRPANRDDEALLAAMRQMLKQSEARQAVLLNASLADLSERTEAQRRYDLARVGAGLAYLEGKTGMQVARTTELMGHVLQASQKR